MAKTEKQKDSKKATLKIVGNRIHKKGYKKINLNNRGKCCYLLNSMMIVSMTNFA